MKRFLFGILILAVIPNIFSQDIYKLSKSKTLAAITELKDFVSYPNSTLNKQDIAENITWLTQAFGKRKFKTKVLNSTVYPLFFAERHFKNATKTILFYMHFDGQSVDSTKWNQAINLAQIGI